MSGPLGYSSPLPIWLPLDGEASSRETIEERSFIEDHITERRRQARQARGWAALGTMSFFGAWTLLALSIIW